VDQYLNNRQNEILWNLLAEPANNGQLYVHNLKSLVNDFPQSGLLRALLSHAEGGQNINHAAAYVNPKTLYKLINSPGSLEEVADHQIIRQAVDITPSVREAEYADTAVHEESSAQHNLESAALNGHHFNGGSELEDNNEGNRSFTDEFEGEDQLVEQIEENAEESENATEVTPAVEQHRENEEWEDTMLHEHEISESVYEEIRPAETIATDHIPEPDAKQDLFVAPSYEEVNAVEDNEEKLSVENTTGQETVATTAPEEILPAEATTHDTEYGSDMHIEEAEPVQPEQMADEYHGEEEVEPVAEMHELSGEETEESSHAEGHTDDIKNSELLTETSVFELAEPPHSIDDDIYDEIVGIESISFTSTPKHEDEAPPIPDTASAKEGNVVAEPKEVKEEEGAANEEALDMDAEADRLIMGNIAATDYFVFDEAIHDRKPAEFTGAENTVSSFGYEKLGEDTEKEKQDVSKYDDDTMPYTFMWWLNKTRREYAGIYQPFRLDTTLAIRRRIADELQQQYYENIFHLSSVEELDRSTMQKPIEFDPDNKTDQIIRKFIVEEPHITTPSSDKLDNENKAKKSSDDQAEIVTETLAKIYTDQMLYHKAINTYRKLMLKFPEKSRYFADQIEQIERKNN
jgi:hypothetical protein